MAKSKSKRQSNWTRSRVAHKLVQFSLERILYKRVPAGRSGRLGPKVANGIGSSQRERHQVINFVVAGLVLRDCVLGVGLFFEPCCYGPHLLRVAGDAHVPEWLRRMCRPV
jgi:hypothetical protein